MTLRHFLSAPALAALLLPGTAPAVTVSVTGNVTAATCQLAAGDATKTLTIPDVSAADLTAGGGLEGWKSHNAGGTLSFSGCPQTVSRVTVSMTGTTGTATGGSNRAAVIPAAGTAQGIVLMLAVGDGSSQYLLFPGAANSHDYSVQPDGSLSLPVLVGVNARGPFDSSSPAPSAGSYSNTFTLSFTYS